jgi:eukaryotic-like serine/threonine-protein kinase
MTTFLERLSAALAGRYRIERDLGAGGMATVHLAHDVRHDRKVALKVLRPELAAIIGAERFLHEIKTTANLQHPHILGLIDSGESDQLLWYVMPFVDGESLRDRLAREGQLPVGDAVRLATEVAGALDYAHRRGVIHRDIKPENILLHDGRALVADFGIALAASKADTRLTETGMSLGTPHYMSPEQATGERTITARSDVYALGCVLYETLIGEPPFTGPTAQAVVAKVVTSEPASPRSLRPTVPPHVDAAILQALAKLPADRFSTAAAFAEALAGTSRTAALPTARGPGWRAAAGWLPWAAALALAGLLAATWLRPEPDPAPPPVYRLSLLLPASAAWVGDLVTSPALAPDGSFLVYNGRDSTGERRLYLRYMAHTQPVPIPGSENGGRPFVSPDGRAVAFTVENHLVRVGVAGGTPTRLCPVAGTVRATWLESGAIVFAERNGLRRCETTGEVTTLLAGDSGEVLSYPHALPADRGVLFARERGAAAQLGVLELRTGAVRSLDLAGSDPRYVSTGHLAFLGPDGRLRAVPFDLRSLSARGDPVVIEEPVQVAIGGAVLALSRSGAIVYEASEGPTVLTLVERSGRFQRLVSRVGAVRDPRVSPDGRRIAVRLDGNIWVLDRTQGTLTRLSPDSLASRPAWSRDGRRIAYTRQLGGRVDLRIVPADGSAPAESLLARADTELWEVLFTASEDTLVVRTVGGAGRRDIWLAVRDADRLVPWLTTPANETAPALSPDGRWLAYVSDESGRAEVYVRAFPESGARYQISDAGGAEPAWSPRGGELFYRSGPTMVAAEVTAGAEVRVIRRTALFSDGSYVDDVSHAAYDVMPDGLGFVMVRRPDPGNALMVTLNLFQNLPAGTGR